MKFRLLFFLYILLFIALTVFSYGFVDANFPLKTSNFLHNLVHQKRFLATMIYVIFVFCLFGLYGYVLQQVKRKKLSVKQIWWLIFVAAGILFFSFPAFSYDIFNYMATAKVTFFYKENPYIVMPIELVGEPMLEFMHAANKTALYGPFWILLTAIPYFVGGGNILLSVFTFKAFVIGFYLGLAWLIWRISKKNVYSLAFFALNPLVIIETLVSSHNDVVMMFFVLLGFYLLFQKKKVLSFASILASTGIKYATIVLFPFFAFSSRFKKEKLITFSCWALLAVFILSPLREEIYSWYLIWIIALVALITQNRLLYWLTISFSFGLLLRYTPFLYTRSWGGITPMIKAITTFLPPTLALFIFLRKRSH